MNRSAAPGSPRRRASLIPYLRTPYLRTFCSSVLRTPSSSYFRSNHHVIHVAVAPALPRLGRADDGVLRGVEVLGGVLVGRRVAAAHVAAGAAHPQVHPPASALQALLAAVGVRLHVVDLVRVRAGPAHRVSSVVIPVERNLRPTLPPPRAGGNPPPERRHARSWNSLALRMSDFEPRLWILRPAK